MSTSLDLDVEFDRSNEIVSTPDHIKFYRPSWHEFFMGLAFAYSKRSHDAQTKHACIIVDNDNHIIGAGYNGFPKGVNDERLSNTRPAKYLWIAHAEINALLSCTIKPLNCVAYVTGQCCHGCIKALWQGGIKTVYMAARHGSKLIDKQEEDWFNEFVKMTGIQVHHIKPNLKWLEDLSNEISQENFYS